jgi:neutrophil factor 2
MSLKAELETWAAALKAYDDEDFDQSLELFSVRPPFFPRLRISSHLYTFQAIADSSKILTNMGLIYATLGEHETAVEQFIAATQLDNYLAVASVR